MAIEVTLASALVAALVSTALCGYWAWRQPTRLPWAQTLAAVLVPLALLGAMMRGTGGRSGHALQVIGQYAFLLDTLRVGATTDADVRIPAPSSVRGTPGPVSVHFDPRDSALVLAASRGAPPTFAGGRGVGTIALGANAVVSLARTGTADTVRLPVRMPWWPLGCLVRLASACGERVVGGPGGGARVRVPESGIWSDAISPRLADAPVFLLFRRDGRVYVAAGARTDVRVNGRPLPSTARVAPGTIELGLGRETARLRVMPDRRSNRLHVLYTGRLVGDRWPLRAGGERAVHRVSFVDASAPGSLPLIDLTGFPLGPDGSPYAGALEWTGDAWRWHVAGTARRLATGRTLLLPGSPNARAERGHLVRISESTSAGGALARIALVWVAGALLLAFGGGTAVPALRVGVLGLAYTLAMARATIALRVAHAEPFNGEAVPTTVIFLVAFPVLVWMLERLATVRGRVRRSTLLLLGTVAMSAAAIVYALVGGLDRALFVAFIIGAGTLGLLVLQVLLVPREVRGDSVRIPLGMFEIGAERGFAGRHLFRTASTLLVLVVLYIALALSLRGLPPYLSMAAYSALLAVVYVAVELRSRVLPRMSEAGRARVARASALVGAVGGWLAVVTVFPGRMAVALAGAFVGAGVAWLVSLAVLAPLGRRLRAWPYRRSDLLPPLWFALTPVLVLVAAQWGAVRRLGITLGFALALAGLLLVVRVFTVLWHRETKERLDAHLRETAPSGATRRRTPAFVLLALTVYAGYLGADRGLMLLLITSVLVTLVMATAMLGPKRLATSVAALVIALGAVAAWLHVPPSELAERPVALATPQVRYAAVRHPQALERQMLVASSGSAREIVSTLQQDWGMRAFAAAGRTWGNGLYGTPYTRRAISEDVALTDNAFAVFVLSEHGFAGGTLLLSAYLGLALLLLASAAIAGRSVSDVPRAILLGGLAMYVAVPALYMAAANVSLLPLTGQNMPLLGLRSGADVAFASWTIALAVVALPRAAGAARGVTERAELNARAMRRLGFILASAAVVLVGAGMVMVRALYRATHAEVAPFQLAAFAGGLRAAVERADVVMSGDSIVAGTAARGKLGFRQGDFLLATVERANAFEAGRAEYRSHCAERSPWLRLDVGAGLQISDAPCKIEAPAGTGAPWTGEMLAGPASGGAHDIVVANGAAGVILAADVDAVARASCTDTAVAFGARLELACERGARLRVRRASRAAVIDVIASGAAVTKNGAPVGSGEALRPGDIVAIDSTATWIVDRVPRGALAWARERNGQPARTIMPGTLPLLARLDSLMADGLRLPPRGADADVTLTIDQPVIRAMQAALERRCAEAGGVRQCAVMLADAESGDIVALAGWTRAGVPVGRFAPLDPNFRNHRAASTIKPFIAAAVLQEYPSLRSLVVDHPGEQFTAAAGWPLGSATPMKSELHRCPRRQIDWSCFLPASNNLYAVTLGFLGAAERGPNGLPALGGPPEGPWFAIGGRRVAGRPRFEVRNGRRAIGGSPLARNLESLFDARIGRESGVYDESMWRAMTERRLLRLTPPWQRVSPDVPQLPLDEPRLADLRYLAGFMIGENENDWSNAALVRGMARIMTGRGVELRLVHRVGDTVLPPVEKPAVRFGAGREHVLAGMRGVVRGFGTAAGTTGRMFDAPGFEFYGKTGTLESRRFEPLSLFLFGGRDERAAGRACPVAGIVYVEGERGAPERLTAVSLFAQVVAPVLEERFGWGDKPCVIRRPAVGETP